MSVTLELQHIIALVVLLSAWGGALIVIIRTLLTRMLNKLEDGVDKLSQAHQRLDTEFRMFQARLPLDYQRREDSIREFTAINMKLDKLHDLFRRSS